MLNKSKCIMGIDIGTSKIAVTLIDSNSGKIISTSSVPVPYLEQPEAWKKEQSPDTIASRLFELLKKMDVQNYEILSIGITGQMHGILGLDSSGKPTTNFVTWQDERGNVPLKNGRSLIDEIKEKSGRGEELKVSSGFGIVTLYSWLKEGINVKGITTIEDYIGRLFTSNNENLIDYTMAESLGCFDIANLKWDYGLLESLKIDPSILPKPVKSNTIVGKASSDYIKDIFTGVTPKVSISIGDNQASFLGSVKYPTETILINIGTGSQISIAAKNYNETLHYDFIDGYDVQIRPFVEGMFLIAGNALSGGASYKTVFRFFKKTALELFGLNMEDEKIYTAMEQLAIEELGEKIKDIGNTKDIWNTRDEDLLVYPLFSGKRSNPSERGWIKNITTENLTPSKLIYGTLQGIVRILTEMFNEKTIESKRYLVGSGNGIRKNKTLQQIIENLTGKRLNICTYTEEAVTGAAINGAVASGVFNNYREAEKIIQYIER